MKELRKKRLTLRSSDALEAVSNFCHHRSANPDEQLASRFLTTASIGKERDWIGTDTAIRTWENVRTGQLLGAGQTSAITAILEFLKKCGRPTDVSRSVWESFNAVVSQDDHEELAKAIDSFEWAMESGDREGIEEAVRMALEKSDPRYTPEDARRVYRDLFAFVLRLLTTSGSKHLTADLLAAEIQAPTLTKADQLAAARLRGWIDNVDAILERHEKEIKEMKDRIPVERTRTFYEPETSPEHSSKDGPLIDFNQTLRGRQSRLIQLDSFLKNPAQRIAILPGRGGIGKT